MIYALVDLLGDLHSELELKGELLLSRTKDWQRVDFKNGDGERGGGLGDGIPAEALEERKGDAAASRYHDELVKLMDRLVKDSRRLVRIMEVVCPEQPEQLADKDLLAAQVAAEGWCVSCHRNKGYLEPVWAGRYREACRFCGEFKAANRMWPPVQVVKWRHRHPGKHVPLKIVESSKKRS